MRSSGMVWVPDGYTATWTDSVGMAFALAGTRDGAATMTCEWLGFGFRSAIDESGCLACPVGYASAEL